MNILMISDVYFPRINGVSTSIKLFRQTLLALGHKVSLIVPCYGDDKQEDGIYRISSKKVILDPEDRFMSMKSILDIVPELSKDDYDLVHIQTPFVAHYAGLRIAGELGIPCVETYHTFFEEYLYHYFPLVPKSWMRYLARYFTRKQCNAVDAVITPSTAMNEVLGKYGVTTSTKIVPTGIDLSELESGDGATFRLKYGIEQERPVIVHVGRVAHEKNIDFLLRMLQFLRINIPDVLLIIAGEGPARAYLKKLTARLGLDNNVMFIGYLARDGELLDCYCAGDAFVFASRTETQGLVLLEAMALGVPLISTAVMGTKDILEPGKGAIVAEEDAELFADKVQNILSDSILRARLANEAKAYVDEWSAQAMTDRLVSFYTDVIYNKKQVEELNSVLAIKKL
ncbi:MAG: glycosyltransferase [Thioalkalispiraceae bacterium]|jgi:glycosyltransferase involved in cell wall biosynthesis